MKDEFCSEHTKLIEDITEVKIDVKWLVADRKRTNGLIERHIDEGMLFRPQIMKNTAYRKAFLWAFSIIFIILSMIIWRFLF